MPIDLRVAELMCSRLCHDLVSPVGAINNGVELIEELGGDSTGEAMALVSQSAERAAALLRCFRLAYGAAGASAATGLAEAREAAEGYLAGTKVALVWPAAEGSGAALPPGAAKVALNLVMLAAEALVYGGAIRVEIGGAASPADALARRVTVIAEGRAAALGDEEALALHGSSPPDTLTPRTVHAYAVGAFARHYRLGLAYDQAMAGRLTLRLDLPG